MQLRQNVRIASHAGQWYTEKQKELDQELDQYLSKAKIEQNGNIQIKAIIGPHAGFYYSGPTAAWCYQYLQAQENINIFLLGPCHHIAMQGCGLSNLDIYSTPLGDIQLNKQIIKELEATKQFKIMSKKDQEDEHSLEMHLPYIFKRFQSKKFNLIPIMVGDISEQLAGVYANIFKNYYDNDNSLFIISSDFCHWGQNFDYMPYNKADGQIWESIQKMDQQAINLIEKHDFAQFFQYLQQTSNTICGQNPIRLLLHTINASTYRQQTKTKFVQYSQSEKVKSKNNSSVSYAASITYFEKQNKQ